ncbi:murein hydrolase activator EnvC family protein [Candidatus Nitrospira inopinata]|jgi:septal ring factor EnvC (AmiA/AmiB activator)|uniref:Putative Murein hydrolase EnvC n=1 Tax=Candidatus Nitrospira inopinata TaxID=1715989 RepID=A0A0S4KUZ3_9BACT|nr:peptidoglycan DD-metalloendopeptidase family protein [Candidatus Nitrospira inopinata]CUQ68220.1 putative Murein hydrolase EnvC [Candidatus Nitrospira inopinata]
MRVKRLLAAALCCAAVGAGWESAFAGDSITEKIEQERKALERLKGKIQEKRKQADEAEKKRESLLQSIQSLDERLIRHRQDHQDIMKKLRKKDREIEDITERIGVMRAGMRERREAILARVRAQYMEGRFGYVKALLASDSYVDFQRRRQYLSTVTHKDYELMGEFKADMTRMEQAERQRAEARAGLVTFKERIEKKLADIQSLQKQKKVYLVKITQEKEAYDRVVEELERSASRVDGLLRQLEARRQALARRPPTSVPALPSIGKGTLPWPVEGQVISFFGRQKHPTFDTYVHRKGIEIRTKDGSAIQAVMPGTVVYADWLKGYGLVIILDHGNGFFSLYAHASKVLVKVGEQVAGGHPIGETGDTGVIGENTLYFELRQGTEPVDPLQWLARR